MTVLTPQEVVIRLTRRANHLRDRIAKMPERDLSWDKSELSALDWVIRRLTLERLTNGDVVDADETEGNR